MKVKYQRIREQVVVTARQMLKEGLVTLTAGNISIRVPGEDMVAVTPSGRPYDTMQPEDVPIITFDGQMVDGEFEPSSETPMHTMIMRELSDVNAVVHTHSPHALAFAVAHKPIPVICNEGLLARSMAVLVTEYAIPGTEEIGQKALETLSLQPGSRAVLLANHGLLTIGASIREAYVVASNVETEAQVYQLALTIGDPVPLTGEQLQAIFQRYQARK
ncbi:MAG: class II aldolase/adducin family protein [Chloroflexota bacterium]|nr:class II aldolase/adducin family protein [Chloroflexota bacterium]